MQFENKVPFDIDVAMGAIRAAVRPFPKAAMFALADEGYTSAFQQLVACVISIRTRDEVSLPAAMRLFAVADNPENVSRLTEAEIDNQIPDVTFHERKAGQILEIASRVASEHGGELPCDDEIMRSFSGVGPKCSNLALGIACGLPRISVDIHVHRVTNRWGIVSTRTPEQTMEALADVLPERYWVEINERLVPFGKHVCTGVAPKCSTCPVLEMCRQVDVTTHR
jgi:endonuclease-3